MQFVLIYLFIAVVFLVAGAKSGSLTYVLNFLMIYSVILGSTILLSSMSMDEAVSFYRFTLTTPIGIKKIIKSKFILLIISIIVGIMGSLIFFGLLSLLPLYGNEEIAWNEIVISMSVFMIGDCFVVPIMFKVGAEKTRYIYIITMFVLALLIMGCVNLCEMAGVSLEGVDRLPDMVFSVIAVAVVVFSLVISYLVTLKVVKNKEW